MEQDDDIRAELLANNPRLRELCDEIEALSALDDYLQKPFCTRLDGLVMTAGALRFVWCILVGVETYLSL